MLLVLGIDGLGLTGCVSGRSPASISPPLPATLEPASESGVLSSTEMEDLVAFGEVLVVGGTLGPAERRYLVEHFQDQTVRSPDYLPFYRTTVSTLEHLAGRRFASLDIRERLELVSRYRLAPSRMSPGADPGPFPAEMRILRTRVVPDLISGYYGSPAGWAIVDYQIFPGRCGDLSRYTRAEC